MRPSRLSALSRLSLMGRLAATMGTIAIAAVALSMMLVSDALDGRLNRLAAAHVQSSANRVAAIAADRYRSRRWSHASLEEVVERSRAAGFDVTISDSAGRPLAGATSSAPRTSRCATSSPGCSRSAPGWPSGSPSSPPHSSRRRSSGRCGA
jgi:hypothetical protein